MASSWCAAVARRSGPEGDIAGEETGGSRTSTDRHRANGPLRPLAQPRLGLGVPGVVAVVVLGSGILAARRVDALSDPKLWAEDGVVFLREAFLDGWTETLFRAVSGYLLVLPRLWAELTTLLPVRHAALSYTLFALASATGAYALVLSPRLRWLIPSDGLRLAVFFTLILLPATSEVHATLTNTQWSFAVALVLLALADEPVRRAARPVEGAAVALLALSTASSLLFWPLFWLRWLRHRSQHNAILALVITGCAVAQAAVVMTSGGRQRGGLSLGNLDGVASGLLLRIGGGVTIGEERLGQALARPAVPTFVWVLAVLALVSALAAARLLPRRSRLPFLAAFAFSCGSTIWIFSGDFSSVRLSTASGRYFVMPLALLVLVWAAALSRVDRQRRSSALLVVSGPVLLALAISGDASLPSLPSIGWDSSAACIAAHRDCAVPLNPQGWIVQLPPVPGAH